jgi:hypothetical protein
MTCGYAGGRARPPLPHLDDERPFALDQFPAALADVRRGEGIKIQVAPGPRPGCSGRCRYITGRTG